MHANNLLTFATASIASHWLTFVLDVISACVTYKKKDMREWLAKSKFVEPITYERKNRLQ